MDTKTSGKKTLVPRTTINSEGRVHYSESFQAWNTLKLKKELFSEFPQLKEKRSKFSYEIIYHRSFQEFEKEIKEMVQKNGGAIPLLLWLYQEE